MIAEQYAQEMQAPPPVSVSLPDPLLELDGVTLQYKTAQHLVTATYRVSFKVYRADRYVLLGPSGCGKSSLLKGIAGFVKPVEGTVRLKLYKGNVIVTGRESPNSLYDTRVVTFEDDQGAYDQFDAEGFIKLNALRLRLGAMAGRKGGNL